MTASAAHRLPAYDYTQPASAAEAIAIQNRLRYEVVLEDDFGKVETIAGIDVSYDIQRNISQAVIVLMRMDDLDPFRSVIAFDTTPFPYIPGLLSFRETPVILQALALLDERPDLLFVDGQGVSHPRRLGIAAHIGVVTGIPAIGVAKSRLTGFHREPALWKGASAPLEDRGEHIGTVLRSRNNAKPLYISPGHRIGHESAVRFVQRTLTRYRLPEPTRIADKFSKIKL